MLSLISIGITLNHYREWKGDVFYKCVNCKKEEEVSSVSTMSEENFFPVNFFRDEVNMNKLKMTSELEINSLMLFFMLCILFFAIFSIF